jgi:hypothetical protein
VRQSNSLYNYSMYCLSSGNVECTHIYAAKDFSLFFSVDVGGQKRDETHVVQDINQSPS